MTRSSRFLSFAAAALLLISAVLVWKFPLANAFHYELAILSAVLVFGFSAGAGMAAGVPVRPLAWWTSVFALVPLIPAQVEQWAVQPCSQPPGFLFYFLHVVPAAICGSGAGLFSRRWQRVKWRIFLVLLLVAAASSYVLWTLYRDAPVRFHHPLFGMWPGSIYDEQVDVIPPLFWGRLEGLLAGLALWMAGLGRPRAAGMAAMAGFSLFLLAPLTGTRVTHARLRTEFAPVARTQSAAIYFHPQVSTPEQERITGLVDEAMGRILPRLGIETAPQVELFVFPSADERYRYTGARQTTYTKPWLGTAYLEPKSLAGLRGERLLEHELVHLVTAGWGPVLGLPWNIALLEGTAVALVPPAGYRLPALSRVIVENRPQLDLAQFLQFAGFWRESAAAAYPVAGAFVEWLLESRGPGALERLWRLGPGAPPPEGSWTDLAAGFRAYLETVEPVEAEKAAGKVLARRKSVFEKRCPHDLGIAGSE